ncbi:Gfo/Idh/MocA family protein [Alkalicoccobacillus plakortidis]|uniref:Gfo/Idh/MocA family oxidoreductase n=1 Tax=Alkalicoccobacillus plakortidis TaxID=444060 RepID=A0ABT0XQQ5_9BACI|nr:Gfo/Idh/MocA family oxidoreductase [Alkalicoccobacillus plakortidis]MCM2677579.1 Gfo/Idh/MocA family oxidoreductase [Alkalicoccobacillus plakortidis]
MHKKNRYKIGIVGAGNVTNMHLEGLKNHQDQVEVTAICDLNPDILSLRAEAYHIPQQFTDFQAFIEDSGIDIAIVCTPSVIRKEVILPLIEAGIAVFCEKPFAETLDVAKEITEASRKHHVPISINQNFRTHYPFDFVKNKIRDGAIGSVSSVKFHDFHFRQDEGWRTQCERNSLSVMGVHWLDGFRWILESEAKSLVCQTYSSKAVECAGDTDASVQILFQNGVTVSYSQSLSSAFSRTELIVVGETGTLVAGYNDVALYKKGIKDPVEVWQSSTGGQKKKPESAYEGIRQLIHSIESNVSASNDCEDNLKTISLLEACYRSAKDQTIIYFDSDGHLQKD